MDEKRGPKPKDDIVVKLRYIKNGKTHTWYSSDRKLGLAKIEKLRDAVTFIGMYYRGVDPRG